MRILLPLLLCLWSLQVLSKDTCSPVEAGDAIRDLVQQVKVRQNNFLGKYLNKPFTSYGINNSRFMDQFAFNPKAQLHYEFGLVELKQINNIDKNLGTAVANAGKTALLEQWKRLAAANSKLSELYEISIYHDFKSVRLALIPKDPSKKLSTEELNQIFSALTEKTQSELIVELKKYGLDGLGNVSAPHKWFTAGAARSLDESAILARFCRAENCSAGFSGFESTTSHRLQKLLLQNRNSAQDLFQDLNRGAKRSGVDRVLFAGEGLQTSVLEVLRKGAEDLPALAKQLSLTTGKDFTSSQMRPLVEQLSIFYKKVDQFQPAILSKDRVSLAMPEAGGISADVRGLGVLNFQETWKALAASPKNGSAQSLLAQIRSGEVKATKDFESVKNRLTQALGNRMSILCSGDDCMGGLKSLNPLTAQDRQDILKRVADAGLSGNFRFTFTPPDMGRNAIKLVTEMESVEKSVNAQARAFFTQQELRSLVFAVDQSNPQGGVRLLVGVGGKETPGLADKVKKYSEQLTKIFESAVYDPKAKYEFLNPVDTKPLTILAH